MLEAVGLLLFDKHLDILAQGALVVLERENIVSLLVEDLARDGALAPHRVNGHDGAVDCQHVQQFRDRHDLVRLLRHLDLAKHQPLARREGGNHMDGGFLPLFLIRAAHRLAVDRDHPGRCAGQ